MRDDMATPLLTDAPDMAIARRRPEQVIHHSDRGSHPIYTSAAFRTRCGRYSCIHYDVALVSSGQSSRPL